MYSVLSPSGEEAFESDIPMSIGVTDGITTGMRFVISPVKVSVDALSDEAIPVISFSDTSTRNVLELMHLRKVDNTITEMEDIYQSLCRRVIKRFEKYASTFKRNKIILYTSDEIIMETLLEQKFSIEKLNDGTEFGYRAEKIIK